MLIDRATRNSVPTFGAMVFFGYLGTVIALGCSLVGWSAVSVATTGGTRLGLGFALVATLVMIAEARPLLFAGIPDTNGVTITTALVFASLIHWGLAVAVVLQAASTLVGERLWGKAWWRTLFNIGQYALSWAAGAVVLALSDRLAIPTTPHAFDGGDILPVIAAAVVYFLVNNTLVAYAIALRVRTSLWRAFTDDFGYQALSSLALLALAPFVALALQDSVWLTLLLLAPAYALYKTAAVALEKEHDSLHDALTGLPNRKSLVTRAADAVDESRRTAEGMALFLLDLDRFKEVNDTLGHHVGDRLLQAVSDRLSHLVRPEDAVARLGGDEFAVLLPRLAGAEQARDIAGRIIVALREPFVVDGTRFDLEGSIGIALFPDHADDFESLMRRADVAMYLAKEARTGVEVYDSARDQHSAERLTLLGDLRRAIDERQLSLHYQPKVDLASGELVGVEALVRWRHPERGLIPPDEFVPLAEQSGLMRLLTDFVVASAVCQAAAWRDGGLSVQVAVNVSVRDLHDGGFCEHLRQACARVGLDPGLLQLEVTEGVLLQDPERTEGVLRTLAEMGVALSLDDFGTGYSSLAHLKRLPVSEIKIDRSFVLGMAASDDDAAIVRSIVELGAALGLRVVAEGVENPALWDRLRQLGCPIAQGYHVARPMPAADFGGWLESWRLLRVMALAVPRQAQGLTA